MTTNDSITVMTATIIMMNAMIIMTFLNDNPPYTLCNIKDVDVGDLLPHAPITDKNNKTKKNSLTNK